MPLRNGRYEMLRPLGQGSQGATFEAVDKREGRLVAIKRFEVRGARVWKDVELAEREARVLASVAHPMLPAYVEHFEEDGVLYLVMERIEGVNLVDFVNRAARFSEADVVRFLEAASVALAYLHGRPQPIIHRDLKPRNVLRRPDGSFAFVDFGAVRDHLNAKGGSTVVGTFGYMAPEQFQGRARPATDVYAVGATALWMLTGTEPEDLPHKGLAVDVAGALGTRASPALVAALAKMLEPDPDRRPERIAPLLSGLQSAVRDRPKRVTSGPPRAVPAPGSSAAPAPGPPPEVVLPTGIEPLMVLVRRALPWLWLLTGVIWWWSSFGTAMSCTIGMIIVSMAARAGQPRHAPGKHDLQAPPVRVPSVRIAPEAAPEESEAAESAPPDEGRRQSRRSPRT